MMQSDLLSKWRGALIVLMLLGLWVARPIGLEPPETIDTPFDTERAIGRLAVILGDQRPHPADSDANDAVIERLIGQIRQAGFAPEIRDQFHCNDFREGAAICARTRNVFFWVTAPGDDAVLMMAHHDSVPAGPGAGDDGLGVAAAIEVAYLMKDRPFQRPVAVLITDAEEAGLIGAAAFAAKDPLAKRMGAIVNLEARGTTGTANMFQTGNPNARDVAAIRRTGFVPVANSLGADLFEHLPNDTDLTMLLPLGIDAANYAIIGGGMRYHTARDDLAALDLRSVRHMGANAIAAVEGFAASDGGGPEGRVVFSSVGSWAFLVVPVWLAGLCLALTFVSAVIVFVRSSGEGWKRTLFAPLLALIAGLVCAILAAMLLGALRADDSFGAAWPIAIRFFYAAAALSGAALVLWRMRGNPVRLTAAAWIWLSVLLGGAFAFIPGFTTLILLATIPLVLAAAASFVPAARRAVPWLLAAAAIIYLLMALPVAGGLEDGLFVEYSAPAAIFLLFGLLFLLPGGDARRMALASLAVLAVAFVTALAVPAYSPDMPRKLNVVHDQKGTESALLIYDNGPLPAAMHAAAAFADQPDAEGYWRAPAPGIVEDGAIRFTTRMLPGGERLLRIRAESPLSDRQIFWFRNGEGVRRVLVNGDAPKVKGVFAYAGCTGRSCRSMDIQLVLAPKAAIPQIRWQRTRYDAGPLARKIAALRPPEASRFQTGDQQNINRIFNVSVR